MYRMNPLTDTAKRTILITRACAPYELTVDEIWTIQAIQNYADIAEWIYRNCPISADGAKTLADQIMLIDLSI